MARFSRKKDFMSASSAPCKSKEELKKSTAELNIHLVAYDGQFALTAFGLTVVGLMGVGKMNPEPGWSDRAGERECRWSLECQEPGQR